MTLKLHTVEECSQFKNERKIELTNEQAKMMVKKLARHFKLSIKYVYFRQCRTSTAYHWGREIKFWHNPDVRIVCHEVNHFLCWKVYGTENGKARHGSKKWYRQLNKIINYAKKKNYWKEEFEKRTTPKTPKPEPTAIEIRLKKIERLEAGIKRHQTKIKRCTTLIKKNNRRISALKRFL